MKNILILCITIIVFSLPMSLKAAVPCPVQGLDKKVCPIVVNFFDEMAKHDSEFAKHWQNHQWIQQSGDNYVPPITISEHVQLNFRNDLKREDLNTFITNTLNRASKNDPKFNDVLNSHNYFVMTVQAMHLFLQQKADRLNYPGSYTYSLAGKRLEGDLKLNYRYDIQVKETDPYLNKVGIYTTTQYRYVHSTYIDTTSYQAGLKVNPVVITSGIPITTTPKTPKVVIKGHQKSILGATGTITKLTSNNNIGKYTSIHKKPGDKSRQGSRGNKVPTLKPQAPVLAPNKVPQATPQIVVIPPKIQQKTPIPMQVPPMVVNKVPTPKPQAPVLSPNKVPQATPQIVAVPPKIQQKTPIPMQVPPMVVNKVPTLKPQAPVLAPNKVPQATPQIVVVPPKIQQKTPTPMQVPPMVVNKVPTPKPQEPVLAPNKVPYSTPNLVPQKQAYKVPTYMKNFGKSSSTINHKKVTAPTHIVVQKASYGTTINNINKRLITNIPGSQIENNTRHYVIDDNSNIWSCKVSGLGYRVTKDINGKVQAFGHVETNHIKSPQLAHIPASYTSGNKCLIAVHK